MNKFTKVLKYIIFGIGIVIILSGCDNFRCRPDTRKGYFGLICDGDF